MSVQDLFAERIDVVPADLKADLKVDRPSVLVVEDDPLVAAHLREVLEEGGYRVDEAATADRAFELSVGEAYDVVVTDISTPGQFDGVDLAWGLQVDWPDTKVVVVSGKSLPPSDHLPEKTKLIAKPIDRETLLSALKELTEQ